MEHSPNPVPLPHAIQHYLSTIRQDLFNLRRHSLVRASALVLLSLTAALLLSDFPNNRPNLFLILPALIASLGTLDTIRCMQTRWSYYHAGVILCVYMDIMAVGMIVFFLLYPYMSWLPSTSQTR